MYSMSLFFYPSTELWHAGWHMHCERPGRGQRHDSYMYFRYWEEVVWWLKMIITSMLTIYPLHVFFGLTNTLYNLSCTYDYPFTWNFKWLVYLYTFQQLFKHVEYKVHLHNKLTSKWGCISSHRNFHEFVFYPSETEPQTAPVKGQAFKVQWVRSAGDLLPVLDLLGHGHHDEGELKTVLWSSE